MDPPTTPSSARRRPAARARWATTGITAAVAAGSIAAMGDAAAQERRAERGHAYGVIAAHERDSAVAALMGAADPGNPVDEVAGSVERPARLGVADVS